MVRESVVQNQNVLLPQSDDVLADIVEITPAVARQWLQMNTSNRPVSQRRVNQYAQAIRQGEWLLNGDSIKLTDAELIDGQHRLLAVVAANIAIRTVVVYGLTNEVFTTIDQGRKRSTADMIAVAGREKYRLELAATASFIWWARRNNGDPRSVGNLLPSQRELIELALSPEVISACEDTAALRKKIGVSPGACGYLAYMLRAIDREQATLFLGRLYHGTEGSMGDPVLRVREVMLAEKARKNRVLTPYEKLAYLIKAWNAWRVGRTVRSIFWKPSTESFPVPF